MHTVTQLVKEMLSSLGLLNYLKYFDANTILGLDA
jgi:hypothetical protein